MENKEIYIDGVDVSGCSNLYDIEECICIDNGIEEHCKDKNCYYKQLKRKEQECEELKEAIKTKTGKDYINEIQDITMKYECHQKSMGVCWWGKYGKETKCIGIRECHKRELEVIQKLETTLNQLKEQLEAYKMEAEEGIEINTELKAENDELKNLLKVRIEDLCDSCGASSMMPMPCKVYEKTLTEIKEIAKPYQRDIDKICGYCRKYDSCHACCIDDLKFYEYRTSTTKACERFVELERFNINIVANKILQKISEVKE